MYYYRLNLTETEAQELKGFFFSSMNSNKETVLRKKIFDMKKIHNTDKKKEAMSKATKARTQQAKKKIENSIRLMLFENKKLTHYQIAKHSGVSFVTVIKYIKQSKIDEINNNLTEKQKKLF